MAAKVFGGHGSRGGLRGSPADSIAAAVGPYVVVLARAAVFCVGHRKKTLQISRLAAKRENQMRMTPPLVHHCVCTRFCRSHKGPAMPYRSLPRQSLLVFNREGDSGSYIDWRIARGESKTQTNEPEGTRRTIRLSWYRKHCQCCSNGFPRRPRKARS